jgi:uncharacterized protein (DUF305 family)
VHASQNRALILMVVVLAGCSSALRNTATMDCVQRGDRGGGECQPVAPVVTTNAEAIARAREDSVRYPYIEADVRFMTMMIGHHAQAIKVAQWAASHGASPAVQRLADRIINAQQDEIVIMQQWLVDRQKPLPAMDGHQHHAHMPGMLTDEQLAQLDKARGAEFDRLFLTLMIQHHRGAVTMVKELLAVPGAAVDLLMFKFSSDVNVDQSTEIARMEQMLANLTNTQRNEL